MANTSDPHSPARRNFLATTGGVIAGAVAAPRSVSAVSPQPQDAEKPSARPGRKILIGVFDPAFPHLTTDQLVEKYASLGVEAAEIGTGGYPGDRHCPVQELLDDPAK